ncbi:Sulfotransferase, partial [Trinorchestia longiramus]
MRQRADEIWRQCIKINTKNYTEIVGAGDAKNNSPPLTDFLTAQLDSALSSTLIFLDNGITWCPVPKAASTSWAGALLRLQRPSTALLKKSAQVALKRRSRSVPADEVLSFVSASESFLVTRHPLHRVVSAFRNKLETSYGNHDGAYFYKNYGSQIVRKYRKLETVQLYKKAEENWLHFVQFTNIGNAVEDFPLIIKVEDNFNGKQRGVTIMKIMEILMMKYDLFAEKNSLHAPPAAVFRDPTFEEFVRYLIGANPAKLDEHWKSIHLYCQVCRVRYEFVLRYENLHDEATAFVQHLKSEGVLPQHFALHHDNKGGTSDHVIRKYLSLLPAQLLDKLISMYKSDLDIFDY